RRLSELDREPADLGLGRGLDPAAGRAGQELGAEADAEGGRSLVERLSEVLDLEREPGVCVVLVRVRGPAHREDGVVAAGRALRPLPSVEAYLDDPAAEALGHLLEEGEAAVVAVQEREDI